MNLKKVLIAIAIIPICMSGRALHAQTLTQYHYNTGKDSTLWVELGAEAAAFRPAVPQIQVSDVLPIGFHFPYGPRFYEQFRVSVYGDLFIGTDRSNNTPLTNTFQSSIDDIIGTKINAFGSIGSVSDNGYVKYATVGTAPNRTLVVEYKLIVNTSTLDSAGNLIDNPYYTWQIHLHENGTILMLYPQHSESTQFPLPRVCGLSLSAYDIDLIDSTHHLIHTNAHVSQPATFSWPDSSRYYRFARPDTNCPVAPIVSYSVAGSTASFSWETRGINSLWKTRLYYNNEAIDSMTVGVPFVQYTGLEASNRYRIDVHRMCNGAASPYKSFFSFYTECPDVPDSVLPWTYGFDLMTDAAGNDITPCYRIGGEFYIGSVPYAQSNALYMQHESCFVLPSFESDWDSLMLSFRYKFNHSYDMSRLTVGVCSDINDPLHLDTVISIDNRATIDNTQWNDVVLPLHLFPRPDTTGGRKWFLVIAADNSNQNAYNLYLEDIAVFKRPSCMQVYNPRVFPLDNRAYIHWQESGFSDAWQLDLYLDGTLIRTVTVSDSTHYILDNLTPNTDYTLTVTPLCDGGLPGEPNEIAFSTICQPIPNSALPWRYSGETDAPDDAAYAPCLNKVTPQTNATFATVTAPHTGNNGCGFTNTGILCLPMFESDIRNLKLTFWMMTNHYQTVNSYTERHHSDNLLRVGVINWPDDDRVLHPVAQFSNSQSDVWEQFSVDLSGYAGDGKFIVLQWIEGDHIYIDDIQVGFDAPCSGPTGFTIDNITDDAITLRWDNTGADNYRLSYARDAFNEGTLQVVEVSDTTYRLFNPAAYSNYRFYLQQECADGEYSVAAYTWCRSRNTLLNAQSLPYYEDFEEDSRMDNLTTSIRYKHFAEGWTMWSESSNFSNNYPRYDGYVPAISGSKSLTFYSNLSFKCYALLPPIDSTTVAIENLELTLTARKSVKHNIPTNARLEVGVMSNPNDTSTFYLVETIDMANANTDETRSYSINFGTASGHGNHIALRAKANTYNDITIDNVILSTNHDCIAPTRIHFPILHSNMATVSWPAHGSANEWDVYVGRKGFDLHSGSYLSAGDLLSVDDPRPRHYLCTDTILTITYLEPNTKYDILVVPTCTANAKSSERITFTTTKTPNQYEDLPLGCNTTNSIYGKNFYVNGDYLTNIILRGGSYSSHIIFTYLALPEVDLPIQNLVLNLRATYSSSRACFFVGVMSNPNDISTFDTLAFYKRGNQTTATYSIPFNNYTGNGRFITLLSAEYDTTNGSQNATGYTVTFNDVNITTYNVCHHPSTLLATDITDSSANLSWNPSPTVSSGYTVAYSTQQGFHPDSAIAWHYTPSEAFMLTGLQPSTTYYWRVSTNCTASMSDWSEERQFHTDVRCYPAANVTNLFGSGDQSYTTYTFYNTTTAEEGFSANIITMDEIDGLGLEGQSDINSISLFPSSDDYIPSLKIYMKEVTVAAFSSAADTALFDNMTLVYDGDLTCQANTRATIVLQSPFEYTMTGNLLILIRREGAPWYGTAFRTTPSTTALSLCGYRTTAAGTTLNATVFPAQYRTNLQLNMCYPNPSCTRPYNLHLDDLTHNSATLSWSGNSGQYNYVLLNEGETLDVYASGTTVYDSSLTLSGLQPNTTYTVYLHGNCGSDISIWSRPFTFTTPCLPLDVPYVEAFEGTGSPLPPCWFGGDPRNNAPHIVSDYAIDSSHSLLLYANRSTSLNSTDINYSYVALPLFNHQVDSLMISFDMMRTLGSNDSPDSHLVVGVMNMPDDPQSFQPVATIPLQELDVLYPRHFDIPLAGYDGSGRFIAIFNTIDDVPASYCSSNVLLDNVSVDFMPPCIAPVDIVSTTDIGTQFLITWHPAAANTTSYIVEIGPSGFTPGSGRTILVADTSLLLDQITYSSDYDIYIRSICDNGDTSLPSSRISIATYCGLVYLPYTQDFEHCNIDYGHSVPRCWRSAIFWPTISTVAAEAYTNSHSGSKCLVLRKVSTNSATAPTAMAIMPGINNVLFPMQHNTVSFWARADQANSHLQVGVLANLFDSTSFTLVQAFTPSTTWQQYTVNLNSYTGSGYHIAFRIPSTTGAHTVYIDDITVDENTYCRRPQFPVVSDITKSSAVVNWYGESDSYDISIREHNGGTWSSPQRVDGTRHIFMNLRDTTPYDCRIRSRCDGVAPTSQWVEFTFYTRAVQCVNPLNFHSVLIDSRSVTLDWQPRGEESFWELHLYNTVVDTTIIADHHPFTVGPLSQATTYSISLKPVCSNSILIANPPTVSFTTTTCSMPQNVEATAVTLNSATIRWNGDAVTYDIEYGLHEFAQGQGQSISGLTAHQYTLSGLLAETDYDVYVRSHCANGTVSNWSAPARFLTSTTALPDAPDVPTLTIYPNPAHHVATLSLSGFSGQLTIRVVDLHGRAMQTIQTTCENVCTHRLQVESLPAGAYFVHLTGDGVNIVRKLILK